MLNQLINLYERSYSPDTENSLNRSSLVDFSTFIKEKYHKEAGRATFQSFKKTNIPVMKIFANLPEERFLEFSESCLTEFLDSIIDGTYYEKLNEGLNRWEFDKSLGGISPTDNILTFAAIKNALLPFIPHFSNDNKGSIELFRQLDEYYARTEELVFELTGRLSSQVEDKLRNFGQAEEKLKDKLRIASQTEEKLKLRIKEFRQLQKVVHLGDWEYNIQTGQMEWSEEVYDIFGKSSYNFQPTFPTLINLILPEDVHIFSDALKQAEDGNPRKIDFRIVKKYTDERGNERTEVVYAQSHIYGVFSDSHKLLKYMGTMQDMTACGIIHQYLPNAQSNEGYLKNLREEYIKKLDEEYREKVQKEEAANKEKIEVAAREAIEAANREKMEAAAREAIEDTKREKMEAADREAIELANREKIEAAVRQKIEEEYRGKRAEEHTPATVEPYSPKREDDYSEQGEVQFPTELKLEHTRFIKETAPAALFSANELKDYHTPVNQGLPKKILIAESDTLLLKSLEYCFSKEGYKIVTAKDGKEAIEKIERELPDMVITDFSMPSASGMEITHFVKNKMRSRNNKKTPVIVISKISLEKTIVDTFQLGADDYITSPFSPYELLSRIKRLFNETESAVRTQVA